MGRDLNSVMLNEMAGGVRVKYINPDQIWRTTDSGTFIVLNNKLYLPSDYPRPKGLNYWGNLSTHIDMLLGVDELRKECLPILASKKTDKMITDRYWKRNYFLAARNYRINGMDECVFGRYALDRLGRLGPFSMKDQLITVWNDLEDEAIMDLVKLGIRKLFEKKILDSEFRNKGYEIYFSSPDNGTVKLSSFMDSADDNKAKMSPEEKELYDLRMRLHVAVGVEKAAINRRIAELEGRSVDVPMKVGDRLNWRDALMGAGHSGYLTQSESRNSYYKWFLG